MKRKEKLPGRFSQGKALLAGIIKCSHCNKRMWATSKTKTAQAYYVCATWHQFRKCVSNFVPMERADEMILNNILDSIKDEGEFIRSYQKKVKNKKDEPIDAIELQKELLSDLEKQRKRVKRAYRESALSIKDMKEELADIDGEIAPITEKIEELREKESQRKSALEVIQHIKNLNDVKKNIEKNKPQIRTQILELLDSVEATKKGRGEHAFKVHFNKFAY